MTTVNIKTSTTTINNYNNTDQTINPNMYIPTKVCKTCRTIKKLIEFYKRKDFNNGYHIKCKNCGINEKQEYYDSI